MTRRGRLVVFAVLALVVISAIAPIGGTASGAQAENNTTETPARHEHPDNRSRFGRLGSIQRYLSGRMGEVLVDCTEGAQAREWGVCDTESEYPEWLGKYVDVAGETRYEGDDRAGEAFESARENQREFNRETREFWETHEEYQEARENGETERARELARELRRTEPGVRRSGQRLQDDYRGISNDTQLNLTGTSLVVDEIIANVSETTDRLESELFVATTLTVAGNRTAISFRDPLGLTGQLETANGTALANRTITVAVGAHRYTTRTDESGTFSVAYRPTVLPVNASSVTVRYLPRPRSVYLPANGSVPVTVSQVTPVVTVEGAPSVVQYADTMVVAGRVQDRGRGAAHVPVRVRVGREVLGTVRTGENGTYRVEATVPAGVPAGDRSIEAAVARSDAAIGPASATTPVTVDETATELTLSASHVTDRRVRLTGRLVTDEREGIPGRPVRIGYQGERLTTATTDETGQYALETPVPGESVNATTVTVDARFDGDGTNLATATATDRVTLPAVGQAAIDGGVLGAVTAGVTSVLETILSIDPWLLGAFLVFALVIVSLVVLRWRYGPLHDRISLWGFGAGARLLAALVPFVGSSSPGANKTDAPAEPASPLGDDVTEDTFVDFDPAALAGNGPPDSLLAFAEDCVHEGDPTLGMIAAYAHVRAGLAEDLGGGSAATHWEFYEYCRSEGLDEARADMLRALTTGYETAAFSPAGITTAEATALIDRIDAQHG